MITFLIVWAVFGLIVGLIAKAIHPGEEPGGFLPTVLIGVAGSYLGGAINWFLGYGSSIFEPSGWIMSILGGVLCCALYNVWLKQQGK